MHTVQNTNTIQNANSNTNTKVGEKGPMLQDEFTAALHCKKLAYNSIYK